jgi:uncharacterized phage infection (PIP) family protein YhgE
VVRTLVYFGSVVNPTGHLRGLPVAVVNEDAGAKVGSQPVDFGQQHGRRQGVRGGRDPALV